MNQETPHIIIVSSKNTFAQRTKQLTRNRDISVSTTKNQATLYRKIEESSYDVIIIDGSVGFETEKNVVDLVKNIKNLSPRSELLLLIKSEDLEFTIPALKIGTFQYAKLPISDDELTLLLEASIDRAQQQSYLVTSEKDIKHSRMRQLVGSSQIMQRIYKQIQQAAQTLVPILIMGETGTGKDLAAQAIHKESQRVKGPFIPVNLAALPAELIASELFGYEKGAFTGASYQYKGKFEQASEGSIFLDEVDTVEEKVQVSLLRLIEQNRFHRLGGKRAIKNTARLIAASNQNLHELADKGIFREDLLFRLDVFRIVMPPLRERHGDVNLLAHEFLARFNHDFSKDIRKISPIAMQILEEYPWPGNVRELRNVIQRAVLMCETDEIKPEHLSSRFRKSLPQQQMMTIEIGTPLQEIERRVLLMTLEYTNNNRSKTARLLGISRRTLYNKLASYGLL